MGETRVDLAHLLEDLRDAYPGSLEETILTETVANSLDSGATRIGLRTDPPAGTLVVADDGRGMARRELARYHDIAASTKTRGQGIGFAGVGIKLGLLACAEVLTETCRGGRRVATLWRLSSPHRAPWRWTDPPGLIESRGTAVALRLRNPLSPLLDAAWLEATLRLHFEPVFDAAFDEILAPHYPGGVTVTINGRAIAKRQTLGERAAINVFLLRKRKPSGVGLLTRAPESLAEDSRGIAISTLGKVIRRGWEWLGLAPATPDLVGGLVEVPALAEVLTLSKADFLRSGPRGIVYLAYRKAIQQAVSAQLAAWGESRDTEDSARRRAARPLERDLEAVLVNLAEDFPALSPLVEQRAGGQKRLPTGRGSGASIVGLPEARGGDERAETGRTGGAETGGSEGPPADEEGASASEGAPSAEATPSGVEPAPEAPGRAGGTDAATGNVAALAGHRGPRRPVRYGLSIQFEERTQRELGRLVETTVWINTSHPAYRRAVASRSEGYHIALAVAMALAPLAVEPAAAHGFVTAFLERWGEALTRDRRRRQGRPRPGP